MARLEAGSKAPTFTLSDHAGRSVALSDFRGQRVVLYFYPADDTPGCTKEACQFNDALRAFADLNVTVLGVSPDDAASHDAFRQKYGLNVNLLSDPTKKVMTAYGAFGEKMLYGKKVQGVIRSTFLISDKGVIERAWYNVRADGHAAKVLAAL
ncbi:MAG: thioredoxin-dependent thiol peroxidase [Acidobacteriota bacterium]|nr:thioredoxin-dependent thiol peroxidase [Acidobacteriota bacterium]MDE3107672.1 thioredoxin-dependent thiol peroxidase [Acidobacteriota bacterium]